jgi:low temperature requirement protein LtrA
MGAFATAFVGSVAMWWIYFNIGAERARRNISSSSDPGRVARLSYTYLHIPLVAGIIVAAVGDELLLAHPEETAGFKSAAVLLGGPALYLTGNLIFKRATANSRGLSHMIGLSLLALLSAAAASVSLLTLGAAATLVLVVVAVWETRSLRQHTPGAE